MILPEAYLEYFIKRFAHLLHFSFTVNLHMSMVARSEVNLSQWFQLPILGHQGMVSSEAKSRM